MTKASIRDRLASLEALIAAETDDPLLALAKLSALVDPTSLRRRIAVLIKLRRYAEARDVVASRPAHEEWIEIGARAAVFADDMVLATRLLTERLSLRDSAGSLGFRTATAFCDAVFLRHMRFRQESGHKVSIYAIDPAYRVWFERALDVLEPDCARIVDGGHISSPLERDALTVHALCLALVGNRDAARYLPVLLQFPPVHIEIAHFAVDGLLPAVPGMADKLSTSDSSDFVCGFFRAILRHRELADHRATFGELTMLIHDALEEGDRGLLFNGLSDIAFQGGDALERELEQLRPSLLNLTIVPHRVAFAIHHLKRGNQFEAASLLDDPAATENPYWSWARAQCYFANGETDKGLDLALAAATAYLDDSWLKECADRAYRHGRTSDGVRCLELVRQYYPAEVTARRNLSLMLWDSGRFDEATAELEYLVTQRPEDLGLHVQLARGHIHANRPDRAIAVLEQVCKRDDVPVSAPVVLALTLREAGHAVRGLEVLEKYKKQFWDMKEFLFAYLEVASAAGRDDEMGRAVAALQDLNRKGALDPRFFREASLQEVIDLGKRNQERKQKLDEALLHGRVPWAMCAAAARRPLLWDWMIRTQPLRWRGETVASYSDFSLYSTNGFTIDASAEAGGRLVELSAPAPGGTVCVDYSALLTVHGLGLLPVLLKTYSEIVLPVQYRASVFADTTRLRPHQASHREGYEAIRRLISLRTVEVVTAATTSATQRVDEYSEPSVEIGARRLIGLVTGLSAGGAISKAQELEFRTVATHVEDPTLAPIRVGSNITVDLQTLMTIYRCGLLDVVTTSYRVHIDQNDHEELLSDIMGFDFQDRARDSLASLWNQLSNAQNVRYLALPDFDKDDDNEDPEDPDLSLAALRIAEAHQYPLFVDDRTIQAVVLNARRDNGGRAFGTDVFLRDARERNSLSGSQVADYLVQLMRWRYKFIVPDPETLHIVASKYSGVAPGTELADIAKYAHDCMRDLGLFGGLENCVPPMSMALKLYLEWTSLTGAFLALVWADTTISDARATSLTTWAAETLLPTVPIAVGEDAHSRLATRMRDVAIVHALLRTGESPPSNRVPRNLRLLAQSLGIAERRFENIVAEIVAHAAS